MVSTIMQSTWKDGIFNCQSNSFGFICEEIESYLDAHYSVLLTTFPTLLPLFIHLALLAYLAMYIVWVW